jgi:hypothetical protein
MRYLRRQADAAAEQARTARDQTLPLVYAHEKSAPRFGPIPSDSYGNEGLDAVVEFTYYLSNEGVGAALNIEHGVELDGRRYPFGGGDGMQFRSCQPGEFLPPVPADALQPVPRDALRVAIPNETYERDHGPDPTERPTPVYYCRYQSLFRRRWETRNPADPQRPPQVIELGC